MWCCTVKKGGAYPAVSIRGDTLRGCMRRIITRCDVDPVFTGGSIRQAASSKAIHDGWEPAAVLERGMWKSFAMWNRFYNRSRLSMSKAPLLFVPACEVKPDFAHPVAGWSEGPAAGMWSHN